MKTVVINIFLALTIIIASASDINYYIRAGDHFMKRGEYDDALKNYRIAEKLSPNNPDVMWRIGAALNRIAESINSGIIDTLRKANDYLTKAISTDKKILMAHTELARNLLLIIAKAGKTNDMAMWSRAKEELNFAQSMDSNNAENLLVMGLWNRYVSKISLLKRMPYDLGDASQDNALKYIIAANKLDPKNPEYKYELIKQYIIAEKVHKAQKVLEELKSLPPSPKKNFYLKKAQELIDSLKNKKMEEP